MMARTAWLLLAWATCAAAQDTKPFQPLGFSIEDSVVLPVDPPTAFDLATGDVRPWWDHSFSEQPRALTIEPQPGGRFYETFDDEGNGCIHATVTYVHRGKTLRMEGPFGLAGKAAQMVVTWQFQAEEGGQSTRLTWTVNASGQLDEGLDKVVAQVWRHFLVERLKPYVESGKWKDKPGAAK
jgi:hypothetical protein